MTKHQDVAKALKNRLSELKHRIAEIDQELHTQLPADSEDQAVDLENQEALEALEKSGIQEIRRIEHALKRISEGTYGICAQCGADIDPKRLAVLPTATTCISCAV
jgi:RNA polymerase-binding protein DksA